MPNNVISRRLLATSVAGAAALALAAAGSVPAQALPAFAPPGTDARVADIGLALPSMSAQEKVGQLFVQRSEERRVG